MAYPFDPHPNGAYSTLANAPDTAGTAFQVQNADIGAFAVGANCAYRQVGTVRPVEIGRVTATDGVNTLTVTRNAETGYGLSSSLNVAAGWEIYQGPTAKSLTDIEQYFGLSAAAYVHDEMLALGSSGFGNLGWATTGTASIQAGSAGHPGVCRIATGAAFSSARAFAFASSVIPSDTWLIATTCLVSDASSNGQYGLGLLSASSFTPSDAIYFRKAYTDTNWQCVCRASNTETVVDSGVAAGTSFGTFVIRRIDSTHIGFTAPGGSEKSIATNIPTAALFPYFYLINNNSTPVNIWFDVDAWLMLWTGLTR